MKTYEILEIDNREFPLNVRILIDGWYCGYGRFCRDMDEVRVFLEKEGLWKN